MFNELTTWGAANGGMDTAPEWFTNAQVPEGSKFVVKNDPYEAARQFKKVINKYAENPNHDIYTGDLHKEKYPAEWLLMARFLDQEARNGTSVEDLNLVGKSELIRQIRKGYGNLVKAHS